MLIDFIFPPSDTIGADLDSARKLPRLFHAGEMLSSVTDTLAALKLGIAK
jgi:hypothetical protein